jgi:cardiolipin synthase A/B
MTSNDTNTFQLCMGADAFVAALKDALQDCQTSVHVQFSTFEGDASGQELADLLLEKARQGVDVRLTLDMYSEVVMSDVYPFLLHRQFEVQKERAKTHHLFDHLRENGIKIKRTAPPGFLGRYMLYRDHKKMIVIDDKVAFVGGINVSDHNYAWHDFMVRIEGPLVRDLTRDYCSTWEGATVPLNDAPKGRDAVVNQSAGRYAIFEEIMRMIEGAQRSIVIESPYLLGDNIEPALLRAAKRGVTIRLIIPSFSNKVVYRIWVKKMLRRLKHPNIMFYGYQGEHNMTHAKLMIVDDQRATFGSFNMFELEGLAQKELNIFTSNTDFIAQLHAAIEQDIRDSIALPTPSNSRGRFSYTLLYRFFSWWTKRLIQDEGWRKLYC